jgi:hypothetical protein
MVTVEVTDLPRSILYWIHCSFWQAAFTWGASGAAWKTTLAQYAALIPLLFAFAPPLSDDSELGRR